MEALKPLIYESLQLLLIGMGTVFVILTMLIFLITLVSKLFASYEDDSLQNVVHKPVTASAAAPGQEELIAVISAAIATYKKRHAGD